MEFNNEINYQTNISPLLDINQSKYTKLITGIFSSISELEIKIYYNFVNILIVIMLIVSGCQ